MQELDAAGVSAKRMMIHPIMRLGCGCSFVCVTVAAGTEPTTPCRYHLGRHYLGIDIAFPGGNDVRSNEPPTIPGR